MEIRALLFVDDDPFFLELISLICEDIFPSATITLLSDPSLVHQSCATQDFDCVVLDYRMPEIDGIACAVGLRSFHPFLPIVLLTGGGDEMVATHALQNGVADYIPKSRLTPQSLSRTIWRAVTMTEQRRLIEEQRSDLQTFAHALAHDFRQPLRQITTFTRMISDELADEQSASLNKHLTFVETAATRLTALVDVMSDYTLLSREVVLEDITIGAAVDHVRAAIGSFVDERHGRVTLDGDQVVRGNAALLGQILQNLVVNGIKYNTSKIPTVAITVATSLNHCELVVRDNGVGIDEQYAEKVFLPLFRLHSQAEYTGTGMGLTMVRKAVVALGGAVTCNANTGGGTEFRIKLPLAPCAGRRLPPDAGGAPEVGETEPHGVVRAQR